MVYKNGHPFTNPLPREIEHQRQRVLNNKASSLIVDGGVGEGKTTLLVHILDWLNTLDGKPFIDIEDPEKRGKAGVQLAMGGKDFTRKVRLCYQKKLHCIGYDEAGDFGKRGSITAFNAMLNRTFETYRAFKIVVVLVLPSFNVLDNQMFENKIPRLLLHLKGRGKNTGYFHAYSLYRMELLKYWMARSKIKNAAYLRVWPNFSGGFQNLSPERSKQLDRISTGNKLNLLEGNEIKMDGLYDYEGLSRKLNRPNKWVRVAVSVLKLKAARFIKQKKYFDAKSVKVLENYSNKMADRRHQFREKD